MCEARMLRSNECLRRMSSTGWEIEIVNIREAVIELVRHHMKCVIPKGHRLCRHHLRCHRLRRHPLRGHHNVLCDYICFKQRRNEPSRIRQRKSTLVEDV